MTGAGLGDIADSLIARLVSLGLAEDNGKVEMPEHDVDCSQLV
jgi:hypothetical protein